jgi:hypothetical protein
MEEQVALIFRVEGTESNLNSRHSLMSDITVIYKMYGWWTSIRCLIIFFYIKLAYTIRYGIMPQCLGMFIP